MILYVRIEYGMYTTAAEAVEAPEAATATAQCLDRDPK